MRLWFSTFYGGERALHKNKVADIIRGAFQLKQESPFFILRLQASLDAAQILLVERKVLNMIRTCFLFDHVAMRILMKCFGCNRKGAVGLN